MSKFTVKRDFWGNDVYYDEHGREIGKADTTWLGDHIIRDKNGNKVGSIGTDYNGRTTITKHSSSFFGRDEVMTDVDAPEDWEYCDNCGEWIGDDDHCDICGH